jgi:hypothetical protein
MSPAFRLLRVLRSLPVTGRLKARLDHCAAIDVFRRLGEDVPALRVAHVLGFAELPLLYPAGPYPSIEAADRVRSL